LSFQTAAKAESHELLCSVLLATEGEQRYLLGNYQGSQNGWGVMHKEITFPGAGMGINAGDVLWISAGGWSAQGTKALGVEVCVTLWVDGVAGKLPVVYTTWLDSQPVTQSR
jgi:hypothetical protein